MVAQFQTKTRPVTIYRVTAELQRRRGTRIVERNSCGDEFHTMTYETSIEKMNFNTRPTMDEVTARLAELGYSPKVWRVYQAYTRPMTAAQAMAGYIGSDRF